MKMFMEARTVIMGSQFLLQFTSCGYFFIVDTISELRLKPSESFTYLVLF